ncbi:hypothetical protein FRB98_003198 [Tulasnella sp. 332]|nr:hypothetical protein FRB98_003198 [Tulasnella sp. 332]
MALVCKAWNFLAIDSIWRKCAIPLSKALVPLEPSPALSSHPPISAERWTRYQLQYANKITHLVIDLEWRVVQDFNLERLVTPQGAVFPNLLWLEHDVDGMENPDHDRIDEDRWTPLLPFLIGPKLKKLTFETYDVTKRVAEDNIRMLAHIAPRIDTVVINSHHPELEYSPFGHMRILIVSGHVDHETWKALATCTRLQTVMISDALGRGSPKPRHYSITFPSLETLSIYIKAQSPDFVASLFRNTTMPLLQTLEIEIRPRDDDDAQTVTKHMLKSAFGRSPMLKEVRINGRVPGYDDVPWKKGRRHMAEVAERRV